MTTLNCERALIFLGLYRRRKRALPTWQVDTVRLIARMIAASERRETREYVAGLLGSCDLNVREYNDFGELVVRNTTCMMHEYLQVMTVGDHASNGLTDEITMRCHRIGPTRRGKYAIGLCIELHREGTIVYGTSKIVPSGNANTVLTWKYRGTEIIPFGLPHMFEIVAINRMYYIRTTNITDDFHVRVIRPDNVFADTHRKYTNPQWLQLQPRDFIQVGNKRVWITYRIWQYKKAPIDVPLMRWELNDLFCRGCMENLIVDINDVFMDYRTIEERQPVKIDGKWSCPHCLKVLPCQEMFYQSIHVDKWY